jgi:RNA polymerase sigma-70 factor (ECF subfamily)
MGVEPPVEPPAEFPALDRLRARDHRAFDALVERHYGPVHRYLARLLGNPDTAAELAQETFLRAYQSIARLADDSNLGGWLFRIATNLVRQHYRRRRIGWSDEAQLERRPATGERFEDAVAQQDAVRQALEQLPLRERVCLLLYAWTGYSCPEIGEILGSSTDAVRMTLVRARRRFRLAYGADLEWMDGSLDESHQPRGQQHPQHPQPPRRRRLTTTSASAKRASAGPGRSRGSRPGCWPRDSTTRPSSAAPGRQW